MTGKPSIDRPWLKYYPEGADKVALPKMTAYQYLYERNKDYMDGIALEYYGVKISYAAFFANIDAAARAFTALGVKRGDIVTVMMPNTPEAVYCFYGLNKLGSCANMLSPMFTPEHIAGSIELTESKALVILDKFYTTLEPVIAQTKVGKIIVVSGGETLGQSAELLEQDSVRGWQGFIALGDEQADITTTYEAKMPAVIVYSSGSTGMSKGIVLPNEAFVALAYQYDHESVIELNRGQRNLSIIPLFTSTGISTCLNAFLSLGITAILEPAYGSDSFSKHLRESKPNHVVVPPSMWLEIIGGTFAGVDLSYLINPAAGGEPLSATLENSINSFFKEHSSNTKIGIGWGMCELGATVATVSSKNLGEDRNIIGVGKPLSHITVSAFDPDTDEELSYNERGEIRVITPCRMLGYYKNPEATAEFFREGKDGQVWGCSGDMGYIDEEGNVFIEGRTNDYIRGESGSKIWLFDIENILLADEAVQLCEAVGLTVDGKDVPVAHLVLKQDCKEASETVIRRVHDSCVNALPPDAVPRGYKIREGFSVLPSGKRDTLSLKNERDGFAMVDGDSLREVSFKG